MTTDERACAREAGRGVLIGLLALVTVGVASMLLAHGAGVTAASTNTASGDPVSTEEVTVTTIATAAPATIAPDSPSSTVPPTGAPLIAESDTDADNDLMPITWIAVGVTGLLLAVAIWWMLRRSDDDGPRADPHDSDWPKNTGVI